MDFFNWLGKKARRFADGIGAQVNQNDGGRDFFNPYQPKPQQPQQPQRPQVQQRPARNQSAVIFNQQQQQNKPSPVTINPPKAKIAQAPIVDLGGITKGVGEFVGNVAKGAVQQYDTVSKGAANAIDVLNGGFDQRNKEFQKSNQQDIATIRSLGQKMQQTTDPNERARLRNAISSVNTIGDKQFNQTQKLNNQTIQAVDPVKNAASVGQIGLDIATAGIGTGGVQAAKTAFAQGGRAALAKNLVTQGVKSGAVAAPSGAIGAYMNNGDKTNLGDVVQGAATSFAIGGALPTASYGVAKAAPVVVKGAQKATAKTVDAINSPAIKQAEATAGIPKTNVLNDNEAYTLADYSDYQGGRYLGDRKNPETVTRINELQKQARNAAQTAGIDITSGSRREVQDRIADYLDRRDMYKNTFGTAAQGGFVKVPGKVTSSGAPDISPTGNTNPRILEQPQEGILPNRSRPAMASQTEILDQGATQRLARTSDRPVSLSDNSNLSRSQEMSNTGQPYSQPLRQRTRLVRELPGNQNNPYNKGNTDFNAQQYVKNQTRAQDIARRVQYGGVGDRTSALKQNLKTQLIDRFAPIEDRLASAKKAGAEVSIDNDITGKIDRVLRSEGISQAYMKDNGIDRIIQNVPNTKAFDQYLIAKHSQYLDDTVKTGRSKANDRQLVAALKDQYEPFAKGIFKYNQNLLDTAESYGLLSKATVKKLKKQYPEYVPLNRIFNDDEINGTFKGVGGEASLSKQSAVQKIKGSNRQIESPLESILSKTETVIREGERNQTAKTLASYKDLPGNPFDLKEIKPSETIGNRHTISYLDNGKKRVFETTQEVAEAAKNLNKDQMGIIAQVIAAPARILRLGATGVNVGFTAANVVKDIVGAFINNKNGVETIANPKAFGSALAAALKHDGKNYQELMREGVAGTSFDLARNNRNLNVGAIRSQKNLATRSLYNLRPDRWVRTLEDTIGRSEDFGRAWQYYGNKSSFMRQGYSEADAIKLAADQARNNSTNFARAGTLGKSINQVVPYSNAAIQGARIGTRRLLERPVQTITKMGVAIVAPSAIIAMNNYSTPERQKIMDNIPDYEKEGNIIILGANPQQNADGTWNDVWKIPVPPQHIGIHDGIQRGVASALTGRSYDYVKTGGKLVENYTTINPTDVTKTANNYIPQTAKLLAEPTLNKNFFTGEEVVPESMKNLEAKNQYDKSTSLTAKEIGKTLNISPMQIDNFIRTATAGAGQNVVNASDVLIAGNDEDKQKEVRGKGLFDSVIGRFVGAKGKTEGRLYFESFDKAAKDNKLNGRDYEQLAALLAKETNGDGTQIAKNDGDRMTINAIYANSPALIKTRSDAAKTLAKETGKELDPLFKLSEDKQLIYYRSNGLPRGSAEQAHIKDENPWMKDLGVARSEYFKNVDFNKANASGSVPFPEPDKNTQSLLDQYDTIEDGAIRSQFLRDHPEVPDHFAQIAKYTNDVRKQQGFDPIRTYTQASPRVQSLLDGMPSGNDKASKKSRSQIFNDPEVAAWSQENNIYNLTKNAALAQFQGSDLNEKALKATYQVGNYGLVKNPDGSYALKYPDAQGTNQSFVQTGAANPNARFSSSGKKGGKGRKGSKGRKGGKGRAKISVGNPYIKAPKVTVKPKGTTLKYKKMTGKTSKNLV